MAKEKEARKRTWTRGPRERTLQSRVWDRTGFKGKTVWDLLQLLIVPLVLVLIGFALSMQQDARQREIEDQRAERERELEEQRAQDAAVQAYLDQMSTLLLERDLSDEKVQTLLRARTLTVLQTLDPSRKAEVMQFLVEANLLHSMSLRGVDLHGVDLSRWTPDITGLPTVDLSDANLQHANLRYADLNSADLSNVDLSYADLYDTNLESKSSMTDLSGANLTSANLTHGDLSAANLTRANLHGTKLQYADLRFANLTHADLLGADLRKAKLSNVDPSEADLSYTTLDEADLSGADLSGADLSLTNVAQWQLDQIKSLEGATMPGGQKYEDWLKSRGEHGENSNPS